MAFRNRQFKPLVFPPCDILVEDSTTQFDSDGVSHVSFCKVPSSTIIDKLPRPSEVTIMSQLQAGILNPVSLDDYEVSNLDSFKASEIINSLNIDSNENS